MIVCYALAAGLLAGCAWEKCECCEKIREAKKARLMAEAKVGKEDAQKTALAIVPNGTVKERELEKGKGQFICSFDITTPDSKDSMEVEVDAVTSAVLSVANELRENRPGKPPKTP